MGEFSAIEWLGMHGYNVCAPLGHSPDVDLVADDGSDLIRVQVKTTTRYRNQHWEVTLCTRGGNRSWSGLVKRFSASRCDWLFVLVADGRRWFVPTTAVGGGTGILGRAQIRAVRGRDRAPVTVIWCGLIAILDTLGGVPERSKGWRCKRHGSAFAGSNPAPAILTLRRW